MTLLVVTLTFLVMEPLTYATHRWVMHGRPGWGWHRSHHAVRPSRWEENDRFPLVFAAGGLAAFALGANVAGVAVLVPVSLGAAAYGAAYLFVHDLYIHRRFGIVRGEVGPLERLREAHRIHHLFGGEPYGMLAPVVPAALRRRAAGVSRDPFPAAPGPRRSGRRPRLL